MKLVIFDCDGTLVDSQNAICAAMDHAFTGLGLVAPRRIEVLGVVGLSLPEAFQVLAPEHSAAVRAELSERYKSAFPRNLPGALPHDSPSPIPRDPLFAGAKDAVEALARREDIVLGIATGKSRRGVDRLLEQESWHGMFRTIQTADDHPSKPHPSMIERAMQEAEIAADNTVIIGDTTFDIEMGRNAGVRTIGVSWGYHEVAALRAAGAHALIDGFEAVEEAVDRLLGRVESGRCA